LPPLDEADDEAEKCSDSGGSKGNDQAEAEVGREAIRVGKKAALRFVEHITEGQTEKRHHREQEFEKQVRVGRAEKQSRAEQDRRHKQVYAGKGIDAQFRHKHGTGNEGNKGKKDPVAAEGYNPSCSHPHLLCVPSGLNRNSPSSV
jgi:hypothetical protein